MPVVGKAGNMHTLSTLSRNWKSPYTVIKNSARMPYLDTNIWKSFVLSYFGDEFGADAVPYIQTFDTNSDDFLKLN
jgi:hypothetical protein